MLDDRLILNKYQEPSYWQKLSDYWNKMSADQQIYINNSQNLAEDKLHDIDDDKACEAAYWEAYHRINKET